MANFDELPEFQKELKHLSKKYRTLDDDLEKFKMILDAQAFGIGKNFIVVHSSPNGNIIKAYLACRALRNNHLLRVIYAYFEQEQKIEFIEIYFKGDKENEDRERIKEYLKIHNCLPLLSFPCKRESI